MYRICTFINAAGERFQNTCTILAVAEFLYGKSWNKIKTRRNTKQETHCEKERTHQSNTFCDTMYIILV
jgi:hypothetical protein